MAGNGECISAYQPALFMRAVTDGRDLNAICLPMFLATLSPIKSENYARHSNDAAMRICTDF